MWFTACWLFATQKDGISAQSLHRSLEIGSYPTAWAMLHRLRSCWYGRAGTGSQAPSRWTRRSSAGRSRVCAVAGRAVKKVLTGIAVEVSAPEGDRPVPDGGAG